MNCRDPAEPGPGRFPPCWPALARPRRGLLDGKRSITYDLGSAFTPPCGHVAATPAAVLLCLGKQSLMNLYCNP